MKKTLIGVLAVGIGLLGTFAFSGPTRETDCIRYRGYTNISDGGQWVLFEGVTYEPAIGFTPNKLEPEENYRVKLKRYYSGLGDEKIADATPCEE